MSGEAEIRKWAEKRRITYREAVRQLVAMAQGRDVLGILDALKRRYEEGMTPMELAQLDVLYSWLGYVFQYRAPDEY